MSVLEVALVCGKLRLAAAPLHLHPAGFVWVVDHSRPVLKQLLVHASEGFQSLARDLLSNKFCETPRNVFQYLSAYVTLSTIST